MAVAYNNILRDSLLFCEFNDGFHNDLNRGQIHSKLRRGRLWTAVVV